MKLRPQNALKIFLPASFQHRFCGLRECSKKPSQNYFAESPHREEEEEEEGVSGWSRERGEIFFPVISNLKSPPWGHGITKNQKVRPEKKK